MRVTVRAHSPQGGYTDAVGQVVALTERGITLATRRGERTIQAGDVAIVHVIGQPRPRAGLRRDPQREPPERQPGWVDGGGSSLSQT